MRVAARLANGFALDLVRLTGYGRDVIDGLLLAAISQANVAQVTRSPELQRRYATLDQPPPDEMRRPVSVSAIANSLKLPFETARRRIKALADTGLIVSTPRGVVIPTAPMNSEGYRALAAAHVALLRTLYRRLCGIGLLDDLPRPDTSAWQPDNPPVRLIVRLSSDYLLRLAEPINSYMGDLISGVLLMDVIQANTEHLGDTVGGVDDESWRAEGFVPDDLRRPVRVTSLSARLGIPNETVRRRLAQLVARDLCERKGDGFIVPARTLARPGFVQFMTDNPSHLHRLFGALAEFGILSQWEAEDSRVRGAA
jgi:Mn-dependent DtxR family transcriptional regulator